MLNIDRLHSRKIQLHSAALLLAESLVTGCFSDILANNLGQFVNRYHILVLCLAILPLFVNNEFLGEWVYWNEE